ncbi:hypothetical protein VTK73DRAFT_3060 [Phialemonium thermophilum]|uniref:Uncharacterized protein n=1 Tax=Phialemonium thermophilum TaxID=223376 RepID=A0ABR3X158_9PEZI
MRPEAPFLAGTNTFKLRHLNSSSVSARTEREAGPGWPNRGMPLTSNNGDPVCGHPGPNAVQSRVPGQDKGTGRGAAQRYGMSAYGMLRHLRIPVWAWASSSSTLLKASHPARILAFGASYMTLSSPASFDVLLPFTSRLLVRCPRSRDGAISSRQLIELWRIGRRTTMHYPRCQYVSRSERTIRLVRRITVAFQGYLRCRIRCRSKL